MSINKIDASMVQKAFLSAAAALDSKKEWINELNVFPVPDGDTGTNMTLTMMSAANDAVQLHNPDMAEICKVISSGTLRGARGNSGVITSQLLRGFTKEIREHKEIDSTILAAAFSKAVETAYKAVMKPKEGTILTVARGMGEKASEIVSRTDDIEMMLDEIVKAGNEMLAKTPDMLPVLKQAGVVDSGGQGLMVIVEAAVDSIKGKNLEFKGMSAGNASAAKASNIENLETSNIKYGYCTEFIVYASITPEQEKEIKAFLESIGDSIVCVADEDLFKVHVHTDEPGKALTKGLSYGQLSRIKIDNLREENSEIISRQKSTAETETKTERKHSAVIAVSVGAGLSEIFKGLGADYIIEGGQTMNPSTDDIASAIEKVNADIVYVLPNNKNIILAARQAADILDSCDIRVVPSKSIPLGITALMSYNPDAEADENLATMSDALQTVKYCEVTYAVRDTVIDDFKICNGDYMAIGDDGLLAVDKEMNDATVNALKKLITDETDIVTVYYGDNVIEEDAEELIGKLTELYPEVDFDLEEGDQPVYSYFISVE